MAIFSIALRGGVILEELILCMSLSGRAILHCILPRESLVPSPQQGLYFVVCSLMRFSVLGNTLYQERNTGTVNFQSITFRIDIMRNIEKGASVCFIPYTDLVFFNCVLCCPSLRGEIRQSCNNFSTTLQECCKYKVGSSE